MTRRQLRSSQEDWPLDGLEDSWFDRPRRRFLAHALAVAAAPDGSPETERTDDLDDPWFVWTPET